jgi:hypothetical protein
MVKIFFRYLSAALSQKIIRTKPYLRILRKRQDFIITSLISAAIISFVYTYFPLESADALHIDERKFAVLDEFNQTEIKGIIAEVDRTNGDKFLLPDPNYRNLLFEGNRIAPDISDETYSNWKRKQDNLGNCTIVQSSPNYTRNLIL